MSARYEFQAKAALRDILKRSHPGAIQADLHVNVSAPRLLRRLRDIHMPLDRRAEQRLALHNFKLSVEDLLGLLFFDSLTKVWRLDAHQIDLRLYQLSDRIRHTEEHEKSQKVQFARSNDLPSVLTTSRLHIVLPSMSSDPVTDVLRTELASAVINRYGRPLRAFLEWDLDHVMVNQRILNYLLANLERGPAEQV